MSEAAAMIVECISTLKRYGGKLPMVVFDGPQGTTVMELWRYLEQAGERYENPLVIEWKEARKAFLSMPSGHPDTREALDRLSSAENALYLS